MLARHALTALGFGLLGASLAACGGAPAAEDDAPLATADDAVTAPVDDANSDATSPDTDATVTFNGRSIDLEPWVQGFPYSGWAIDVEHGIVTWFHTAPDGQWLNVAELPAEGTIDPTAGTRVTDIDWSTRSWWGWEYRAADHSLYVWSDEQNQERMNIYRLDLESGSFDRLTDNDYTYGFALSPSEDRLVYVARQGEGEPYDSCLRVRDLATGDETELWCDGGGDDRFTWTGMVFSPDESQAIVRMQHDGDRNRSGLALFDLTTPTDAPDLLLDRDVVRYSMYAVDDTWDGESFLYVSAENGFDNVYRYDLASRTSTAVTDFTEEITSFEPIDGAAPTALVTLKRPHETVLLWIDTTTGDELTRQVVPLTTSVSAAHGGTAVFSSSGLDTRFALERARLEVGDGGHVVLREPLATVPQDLADHIVRCNVERVSIPTFDEVDGAPRELHAFYLTPQEPPADPADRLVRITAFYGGGNTWSNSSHILCAAGVATLSPAVRGSWGFGAEFAALNDGDLGGDEIVDLFHVARWLESEHGYTADQIGLNGGSHGGYAVMRAMTFPPETNGHDDSYPFGFGTSHAGFSNILTFYEECVIPDWVVLEAGDPATEADKLLDRSPISHVELLQAPLLLTHGTNDMRVPFAESATFAEAATDLGKPVTLVAFEGQGHGINGLDNVLAYYSAIFAFYETLIVD